MATPVEIDGDQVPHSLCTVHIFPSAHSYLPLFGFFVMIAWPLSDFWALPLTNAFSKTRSSSFHENTEERLLTLGNSCRPLFLVSFNLLWELLSEELLPPEKESGFHRFMSTSASCPDLHSVEAVVWWDLPASHCPSQSSLHVSIVDNSWDISAQCGIVLKNYSIPCTPRRSGRCGANVRVWHFPLDKPLLAADSKNGAQPTL